MMSDRSGGRFKKIQTTADRFWGKVQKGPDDQCWHWVAYKRPDGYGQFYLDGKTVTAHRTAWQLTSGRIPNGLCVCHKCDNPSCVNPGHLFLGTMTDNIRDRDAKGRNGSNQGENGPTAILTEKDVLDIRGAEDRDWETGAPD